MVLTIMTHSMMAHSSHCRHRRLFSRSSLSPSPDAGTEKLKTGAHTNDTGQGVAARVAGELGLASVRNSSARYVELATELEIISI